MGCSASRPTATFTAKTHHFLDDPSSSSAYIESDLAPIVTRAFSLPTPLVHHPPLRKGDTHHLVSLTSTTYGSLLLIDPHSPETNSSHSSAQAIRSPAPQKIPTPADQGESLSPDSVINAWELMDGLDDDSDFHLGKPKSLVTDNSTVLCSKSDRFDRNCADQFGKKSLLDFYESTARCEVKAKNSFSKPLWKYLSEESLLSKMDPNVVSSYRRALSSRQSERNTCSNVARSVGSSPSCPSLPITSWSRGAGQDNRVLLYFTSLRGIRKTYEDCCSVRLILRGFRVRVDERDISMDSIYRKELQYLLGGKAISLPQVFIRGRHVGGVEEIKQLNDSGELARLFDGFPVCDPGRVCESCGDARFMPCPNCSGSRKIFDEATRQLRRCPDCNENGLVRCPGCCSC